MLFTRSASLIASASLLAVLGVGCASSGAAPESGAPAAVTVTPEMITEGRALYTSAGRCNVCHGPTGQGGRIGPNLTDNEWLWVDPSQDVHAQLFTIIKEGIPQPREAQAGMMPPMGGGQLTDAQIHAIAAYVGSL